MISVTLLKRDGLPAGFLMEGHAGFAKKGADIVCAAASAAAQFTIAGVHEVMKLPCRYRLEEGLISLELSEKEAKDAERFLETFELFTRQMAVQYQDYIRIVEG